MWPNPLFDICGITVNFYAFIYFLSAFAALALALWLGRMRGMMPTVVFDGWLIAIVAGFILGNLLFPAIVDMYGGSFQSSWSLSGILAYIASLAIFFNRHKTTRAQTLESLDVAMPPLVLCQILGRIGCFSAGCCHGKPAWGLPWAVIFDNPASASLYKGIPVHPTQLYEAGGCLVILAILLVLFYRPAWKGTLVWVYLLSYGLLRFVVEFYRGDMRPMVGAFSLNQLICVAFVIIGSVMLARRFLLKADIGRKNVKFFEGAIAD